MAQRKQERPPQLKVKGHTKLKPEAQISDHRHVLAKESILKNDHKKWVFVCPFCGSLGRTEAKKKHLKGSLLWNALQHSWVFSCAKKGNIECMWNKTFGNLISALNPALGEAYKRDRWQSGTTGKGHNCSAPKRIVGVTTGS